MSVEQAILITVLRLTKNASIDFSLVARAARIPAETVENVLRKLEETSFIKWRGNVLAASPDQRVKLAVHAIKLGADFERVCRLLEWKEFEKITTQAFDAYNYYVVNNFRFKAQNGKRWEIDLLAFKQPLVVSVDCKHWKHNWTRAPIIKVVAQHVERTKAIADALLSLHRKLKLDTWRSATIIPVVMSLLRSPFKLYQNTPVVPILQLRSFLNELPVHAPSLTSFSKKISRLDRKITEF